MKRILVYLCKCAVAGIISLVILTAFSMVYYNPPIATVQPDLSTNYKLSPNSNWSYMLEGFGYGKTDEFGYNNAYYADESMADIVFAGSSYTEALQVPYDCNFVYLLNKKFDKDKINDNDFKCVNLGISGHSFEVSVNNFEYIAKKYANAKYTVIETANVEFSPSGLDAVINGKYHDPMKKGSYLRRLVQKNPYFRLMYKKINEIKSVNAVTDVQSNLAESSDEEKLNIYNDKLNSILKNISDLCKENGSQPIILMHERFFVDGSGNITLENKEIYREAFKECCKNNNIKVIDVVPEMIEEYKKSCKFSYGYSNGVPGEGHLNKTGHRIISETVYKKINEMEEIK